MEDCLSKDQNSVFNLREASLLLLYYVSAVKPPFHAHLKRISVFQTRSRRPYMILQVHEHTPYIFNRTIITPDRLCELGTPWEITLTMCGIT